MEDSATVPAGPRGPLEYLASRFAPGIIGMERAKQCLMMALASANDTRHERQRIHVLLYGAPGTAKTSLLLAAAHEIDASVFGPRMSTGGFTIDFRGGRVGLIGKIHESAYQVLALDEIDKCDGNTLDNLLTIMETGSVPYAGGGGSGHIPAHIRVVAAANDRDALSRELLERFDYQVHVPLPTKAQAHRVVRGLTANYLSHPVKPDLTGPSEVRQILDEARARNPAFNAEERRLTELIFRMLIDSEPDDKVRLRPYPGMLRTCHALARLNGSDMTARLLLEGVDLLYPDWNPPQMDNIRDLLQFRESRKK